MNTFVTVLNKYSWTIIRNLVALCGMILLFIGVYMTIKGVAGGGKVNIKTAIFEGDMETGVIGLLYSFLGLIMLVFCLCRRVNSKLRISKKADGAIDVIYKGSLTKEAMENIVSILSYDSSLSNKAHNKDTKIQVTKSNK